MQACLYAVVVLALKISLDLSYINIFFKIAQRALKLALRLKLKEH